MDIHEVMEKRRSCRAFRPGDLMPGVLESIDRAGRLAPYASGGPRRVWYVTLDEAGKRAMQAACFNQKYVGACSAVITLCGVETKVMLASGHGKYILDCAAAAMCMDLMAVSLGLGTCWIGHFEPDKVTAHYGIIYRPVIILLVGYAKEDQG